MNLSLDDAKSLYELAKSSYNTFQLFREELDRAEELARVRSKIAQAISVGHLFAAVDILYDSTVLQLQVDGFSTEYDPAANVGHPSPVKIYGWA